MMADTLSAKARVSTDCDLPITSPAGYGAEESYSYQTKRHGRHRRSAFNQCFDLKRIGYPFGIILIFVCLFWMFYVPDSARVYHRRTDPEWQTIAPTQVDLPHDYAGEYTANSVNSTFGFGKIFVLHLPHRSDKKDQLLMMSRLQNIDLTFLSSPSPSQLKNSGMPWKSKTMRNEHGRTALWRGHMDALQNILDYNLQSALILEDDSDWDINVRTALQHLHQPFASIVNSFQKAESYLPSSSSKEDPWLTKEWDILNLGTCFEDPFIRGDRPGEVNIEHPPIMSYYDPTIDFREHTHESHVKLLQAYNYTLPEIHGKEERDLVELSKEHRRLITLSNKPICMNAYAVSQKGAIKLLYHLSKGIENFFDLTMADLSNKGKIRSWTISPPIMSQWKIRDASFRNSDKDFPDNGVLQEEDVGNHDPWIGSSTSIKNSIRHYLRQQIESNNYV